MSVTRRDILGGIATTAAGIGAGSILFSGVSAPVEASVSMGSLEIQDARKTTRDGSITDVRARVSGQWEYDVPGEKNPSLWQVVLWAVDGEEKEPVAMSEGDATYLSGSGSYTLSGSLIESGVYSQRDFAASEEGQTKSTDVNLLLVFNVFNESEKVIASSELETTATVKITNDAYQVTEHGHVSGSGKLVVIG